jgi:hypothetical protein
MGPASLPSFVSLLSSLASRGGTMFDMRAFLFGGLARRFGFSPFDIFFAQALRFT